jgi:hypothetical protein
MRRDFLLTSFVQSAVMVPMQPCKAEVFGLILIPIGLPWHEFLTSTKRTPYQQSTIPGCPGFTDIFVEGFGAFPILETS